MRIQDGAIRPTANGGWLHRIGDGAGHAPFPRARSLPMLMPRPDLAQLAAELQKNMAPSKLSAFAAALGVQVDALVALRVGYHERWRSWAFPMVDAAGRIVGIRYRCPRTARKWSERGGREGLFVPINKVHGTLLFCEGPTDAAALLGLGFAAIGRPSCTGNTKHCAALARGRAVVVFADADTPGRRGAEALASTLVPLVESVRVVVPPAKDVREWVRGGATREDVLALIDSVPLRRLRLVRAHA